MSKLFPAQVNFKNRITILYVHGTILLLQRNIWACKYVALKLGVDIHVSYSYNV